MLRISITGGFILFVVLEAVWLKTYLHGLTIIWWLRKMGIHANKESHTRFKAPGGGVSF